jgi:hypothetical protein
MTGKLNNRRAVGIVTAALTLGVAGPAAASLNRDDSAGSFVPVNVGHTPAVSAPSAAGHANSSDTSALEYALIGTGGAAVLVVGIGGTRAASRRRQTGATRRSTVTS